MSPAALLRLGVRNLLRHRRRSLLAALAMFMAMALLAMNRGFLDGINRFLRDSIVEEQAGALLVHRRGFSRSVVVSSLDLDLPADAQALARLRTVPHVRAATARIGFGGVASAHDHSVFATFHGLDPVEEVRVCPRRFAQIKAGDALGPQRPAGANLTRPLLTRLGASLGERVTLLCADRDGVLNAVEVEAVGALRDAGYFAAEKRVAYVPLAAAQELLRMPGRALEIALAVDDLARVDEVATAVRAALGPGFEVTTWKDLAAFDREASAMRERASTSLMYVFLVVALVGVVNAMLASVRERAREIGTMMAVGARRRHILALFLVEAAILGAGGGLLGVGVGAGLVRLVGARGMTIPSDDGLSSFVVHPEVGWDYLAGLLAASLACALLAALYPALRASRLRPVEALTRVGA